MLLNNNYIIISSILSIHKNKLYKIVKNIQINNTIMNNLRLVC